MNENIQKEICSNMKTYLQNHWLTSYVDVNDIEYFSICGIRQLLLYAKLDDSPDISDMVRYNNTSSFYFHEGEEGNENKYYEKLQFAYHEVTIAKETKDSTKISRAFDNMKNLFFCDTIQVQNYANMYWLSDIDFLTSIDLQMD